MFLNNKKMFVYLSVLVCVSVRFLLTYGRLLKAFQNLFFLHFSTYQRHKNVCVNTHIDKITKFLL